MELGKAMTWLRNPDTVAGKRVFAVTGGLTALALWASGCGNGGTTTVIERQPAPGNGDTPGQTVPHEHANAQLTFDYLGAGSTIIRVYPGVKNTPEDKQFDGTYPNGETVGAVCKTEGREVHSVTSIGEEPRQSNEWAEIVDTASSEPEYASFVYTTNPHQLMMELPDC